MDLLASFSSSDGNEFIIQVLKFLSLHSCLSNKLYYNYLVILATDKLIFLYTKLE